MKIWIATFLVFSGGIQFLKGQDNPDSDFEAFKNYNGPPSEKYFPELFEVSESTFLAEDDEDGRRSFKVVDAKPRVARSFLYEVPKYVEDAIERDKRETPEDYDYTKSYREFVRDNFGLEGAKQNADYEDDGKSEEDNDYERIKELSEKQTEESKKNPEFCKVIHRDGKDCTVCKNPKTSAESETCSYSSRPKPKKYAYKRERNYNSKDDEDDDDEDDEGNDHDEEASQKEERRSPKQKQRKPKKQARKSTRYEEEEIQPKSKPNRKRKPKKHVPRQTEEFYDDQAFKPSQPYVKTAIGTKVDQVLDEFKKRDWSKCKRKSKEGLTCYYCKDAKGASHEECMYISDDNPEADSYQTGISDYDEPPKAVEKAAARGPKQQTQTASAKYHNVASAPEPVDAEGSATEKRVIKRMVSVKIHENGDRDPSGNNKVFYKKIVQVDKK